MTLKDLGAIAAIAKLLYICMILRGEALHQFYSFCYQVGNMSITCLRRIVLGLGIFFLLIQCQPKKRNVLQNEEAA